MEKQIRVNKMSELAAYPTLAAAPAGWRLVVCDLDGTLLDEHSRIPAQNLAAVAALQEAGIGFTLATGRMDRMARLFVSQLNIRLPIIACNGAVIRDCATDQLLEHMTLHPPDVLTLTNWLDRRQSDYLCYTADAVYFPVRSRKIEGFRAYNQRMISSGLEPIPLYRLTDSTLNDCSCDLVKILAVLQDDDALISLRRLVSDLAQCDQVLSMDNALDIMTAGVSKGTALQKLAGWLNLERTEVVAIGDHDNDKSMLNFAGLGIAMGNATPAIVAASQVQTDHHSRAGVAAAIRKYILSQ